MITELFGMPGGGKSTLALRLAREALIPVISVRSRAALIGFNILFLLKHPLRFFRFLAMVIAHANDGSVFWYKFTNLFLHANAKYQKALGRGSAAIDQGYLQSLISIPERVLTRAEASRYLRSIMLPDVAVVLEVPEDDAERRLMGRHYIVREKEGEKRFLARLSIMEKNKNIILEALADTSVKILVLPKDMSKEDAYSMVRKNL